eukprot:9278982-Heterocapsa_arctica.AAC.1
MKATKAMKACLTKKDSIQPDNNKNSRMATVYEGLNAETTTSAPELSRTLQGRGLPHFPASYTHDYVEKSKFHNVHG